MKRLALLFLIPVVLLAQVYTATVTNGGTNYTTVPIVTSSGGGCTNQPTFAATIVEGVVTAVTPTYLGAGCTSAPSLSIGGPGTGAAATAYLLPALIGIQGSIPSASCNAISPAPGGPCLVWTYECWLTVPQYRVPFYAQPLFVLPGTSQSTSVVQGVNGESLPAGMVADLQNGTLTAYASNVILDKGQSLTTVEGDVVAACSAAQAAVAAWNPWAYYGTYYTGGAWKTLGVQ